MKKLLFILITIGGFLLLVFTFQNEFISFVYNPPFELPDFEREIGNLAEETKKKIFTPEPLVVENDVPESFLTEKGIIEQTNVQRVKNNLPPLIATSYLNLSADLKTEDMLKRQYFSHISPTGEGVADLVEKVAYEYVVLGENLALGNFENDQVLVEAWMGSLGHRENILNPNFTEIGVSVQKGDYKGEEVWFAVQHFGLPLSYCPQPDEDLKLRIKKKEEKIESLEKELNSLRRELKFMRPKRGKEYNEKVERYNQLVSEYNLLLDEIQVMIDEYNNQVREFNECLVM